jgi:hypothetical protein
MASSLAAKDDGWKRPPEVTRKLGIETFACLQDEDDPEGHTLLCLGIGCVSRDTYEWVTVAGGGGVSGAGVITAGSLRLDVALAVDEASTQSFKWEVTRAPVTVALLTNLTRQKEIRLKPEQGIERVISLKNYAAELKRLTRLCAAK